MIKENQTKVKRNPTSHLIGEIRGNPKLPALVIFGGVHGNEKSGYDALVTVFQNLKQKEHLLKGSFYALKGNSEALKKNERYIDFDLNRIWTSENIKLLEEGKTIGPEEEYLQMRDLFKEINGILALQKGPVVFLDLHTTSSHSVPFITIGDTLNNRNFALNFPCPTILGFEEFIRGTMFNYINEVGYLGIGFEGGQHTDPMSQKRHEAFIWLSLFYAKLLSKKDIPNFNEQKSLLKVESRLSASIMEVRYRHEIQEEDDFRILGQFENFQSIKKGQLIAECNNSKVVSPENGEIFMPLYQLSGNDGFFVVRRIKMFWLRVSGVFRRLRLHIVLPYLPGIRKLNPSGTRLEASRTKTKWYVKEIFHLMGFRKEPGGTEKFIFSKRKYDVSVPWKKKG